MKQFAFEVPDNPRRISRGIAGLTLLSLAVHGERYGMTDQEFDRIAKMDVGGIFTPRDKAFTVERTE